MSTNGPPTSISPYNISIGSESPLWSYYPLPVVAQNGSLENGWGAVGQAPNAFYASSSPYHNSSVKLTTGAWTGTGIYYCIGPTSASDEPSPVIEIVYPNGTSTFQTNVAPVYDATCSSFTPMYNYLEPVYVDGLPYGEYQTTLHFEAMEYVSTISSSSSYTFYGAVISTGVPDSPQGLNVSQIPFTLLGSNSSDVFISASGPNGSISTSTDSPVPIGFIFCSNASVELNITGVSMFYIEGHIDSAPPNYTLTRENRNTVFNTSLGNWNDVASQEGVVYFDSNLDPSQISSYSFFVSPGPVDAGCFNPFNIVAVTAASQNTSAPSPSPTPGQRTPEGTIVGAVVGGIVAITLMIVVSLVIHRRRQSRRKLRFAANGRPLGDDELVTLPRPFYHNGGDHSLPPTIKHYRPIASSGLSESDEPTSSHPDMRAINHYGLLPAERPEPRTPAVPVDSTLEGLYSAPLASLVDVLNRRLREPSSEDEHVQPPTYEEGTEPTRRQRGADRRLASARRPSAEGLGREGLQAWAQEH